MSALKCASAGLVDAIREAASTSDGDTVDAGDVLADPYTGRLPWWRRHDADEPRPPAFKHDRMNPSATHEAGHAVAAVVLGVTPQSVTLNIRGGATRLGDEVYALPEADYLTVVVAGTTAARMAGHRMASFEHHDDGDGDLIADYPDRKVARAIRRATALLKRHEPAVVAVAEQLERHGRLSARMLDDLVLGHGPAG